MNLLFTILLFNFLGSLISLIGGMLLLSHKTFAYKMSHYLSSYAAGALLGAVFFDILPETLEHADELAFDPGAIFLFIFCGIIFFFLLERLIHWSHHHGSEDHEITGKPVIPLLIIGDTIHNFVDGIVIAATFMISIPLGIITTIAVGAHEIPQEIGDFGILLKKGVSRMKIIIINILSACASIIGVLAAYFLGGSIEGLSVIILSVAAGFFLYIALSDLIPEIHHENKKGLAFIETISLLLGAATIYAAIQIVHIFAESAH